jgi:hypothetical protein
MLEHRKVDRFELARTIREKIGPFMVRTGSKLGFIDCIRVNNHTQEVKKAFAEFGIEVLPSSVKQGCLIASGERGNLEGGCGVVGVSMAATIKKKIPITNLEGGGCQTWMFQFEKR